MAIKFKNIRNNEVRVAETEPLIAALFNSSDKGPNALVGQDFGWRLAPEVVVEMRRIMADEMILERLAARFKKPLDEINQIDVLAYISEKTRTKDAPVAQAGDYEDDYRAEIARLEKEAKQAEEVDEDDDEEEEDDFNEEEEETPEAVKALDPSLDNAPAKAHTKSKAKGKGKGKSKKK